MEIKLNRWDVKEAIQDYVHKKLGDTVYIEEINIKEEGAIKNPITVKWDFVNVSIKE